MNRRTALMFTMLLGGLVPRSLWGQTRGRRTASSRSSRGSGFEPAPSARRRVEIEETDATAPGDDPPPGFAHEAGFKWRNFDISRYTKAAQSQQNPQKALIEWIFRRTGTADWHGDKIAVLSASKTQLRAYNSSEVLEQVGEVVERFTNATEDVLSIHVQFIAAVDTRWRYAIFSQLAPVGSGPQGQQIWTMRMDQAALVLSQMQVQQGFRKLADQRVEMINGQTLTIRTSETRGFAGGLQRESASGLGFQPRADKLEENITLKLSPLLTFDGDSTDAAIDLTINTVRSFHRTKVVAPREIGPPEMTIDVPEATQTRLDQTVKNWPLGQTLLITGGIHPGILDKKGGWLGTSLGAPTTTEVLVFLDAETVSRSRARTEEPRDQEEPRPASEADAETDVDSARSRKQRRSTRGPDRDLDFEP